MSVRDEILGDMDDLAREPITVWGKELWVWELGGDDRDAYEAARYEIDPKGKVKLNLKGIRAKLAVLSLRDSGDPEAEKVFQPGDEIALGKRNGNTLDYIFDTACRISKLRPVDVEDAKKNFGTPDGAASFSGSPAISNGHPSPGASSISALRS